MKKVSLFFWVLLLLSCSKQESSKTPVAKGNVSLNVSIDGSIVVRESSLKSDAQGFIISIYTFKGELVKMFDKLSDVPAQVELEEGQYYVVAQSALVASNAFEAPFYYGQSAVFTVVKTEKQNVVVACSVTNIKVLIMYDDNVKKNFTSWKTIVYSGSDSLLFASTETRAGYLNPGTLKIKSELSYTNSQGKTISKVISKDLTSTKGGKLYNILISASLSSGSAGINVSVSDSLGVENIVLTDSATITDPILTSSAGLLITELMPDPSKVSDDLGEWIEIYNASNSAIQLQGKMLKQGTLSLKIADNLLVPAKSYIVLGKSSDESVNGGVKVDFVYSGFGLPNSGTKTIQLLDNDGITVLSEMTYLTTSPGKALQLSISKYTVEAAKLPASWTNASLVYGSGDLGTPGQKNE